MAGSIGNSNGHNVFSSDVSGNVTGDVENIAPGLLFAAIGPATGGGQLGYNGGPTQTIALRDAPVSPALAGADPVDILTTDQRGQARPEPAGTVPDIGAFELDQTAIAYNLITGSNRGEFSSGTSGADLMRDLGSGDRLWDRPATTYCLAEQGETFSPARLVSMNWPAAMGPTYSCSVTSVMLRRLVQAKIKFLTSRAAGMIRSISVRSTPIEPYQTIRHSSSSAMTLLRKLANCVTRRPPTATSWSAATPTVTSPPSSPLASTPERNS